MIQALPELSTCSCETSHHLTGIMEGGGLLVAQHLEEARVFKASSCAMQKEKQCNACAEERKREECALRQ